MTGEQRGGRGNRRGGGQRGEGEARSRSGGQRNASRSGGKRDRASSGGQPRKPARPAHSLSLTVSGTGMELHCDTCDLVVGRLAGPQVRSAVEAAHRRHRTALEWESGWVGTCSCGWRTGRVKQDVARQQAADHESGALQAAARGTG